jgi:hypothetical protein
MLKQTANTLIGDVIAGVPPRESKCLQFPQSPPVNTKGSNNANCSTTQLLLLSLHLNFTMNLASYISLSLSALCSHQKKFSQIAQVQSLFTRF